VVLKDHKLSYFEKQGDSEPKGIINFELTKAEVKLLDKKSFQ